MKKLRKDYIFYKKLLYEKHFNMVDEWGLPDEQKYHYEFDFKIYRCFSLSGISYTVEYPDGFINQKKLVAAIGMAVDHMVHDAPNYYRLKEVLWKKGFWNKLC